MKTNKLSRWALCASVLVLPAACAPADDAGNVSFVIQVTQGLLGRKPRGTAEVQSLLGVQQSWGRDAVIDVLMEEPDFVEYWLPVVADAMQVQQQGEFKQDASCWSGPLYMKDSANKACATNSTECRTKANALADYIRQHTPNSRNFDPDGNGTPDAFNMNDVLRAALLVDDLHVAWRPWLFAMAAKRDDGVGNPAGDIEVQNNFLVSAFNVQTGCISCHSATYSKTEVYPSFPGYSENDWDRTAVLGYDLERSAFGNHETLDLTDDADCVVHDHNGNNYARQVTNRYQAKCAGCHGLTGETYPSFDGVVSPKKLTARVHVLSEDEIVSQIRQGSEHMGAVTDLDEDHELAPADEDDEEACARTIARFLRTQLGGYEEIQAYLDKAQFDPSGTITPTPDCPDAAAPQSTGPWGLSSCGVTWTMDRVCGPVGREYWFAEEARYHTDLSNVIAKLKVGLDALPSEPPGSVMATAAPNLSSTSSPEVSVAALLVANIADDILFETTGNRATVAHGLSRTTDQATALNEMISKLVVEQGGIVRISLRNALKEAALSNFFNRQTPAYDFGMYLNPWAATDPNSPTLPDTSQGDNRNGLGDLVHRRSPNQLLWSLHQDLGWQKPPFWVKGRNDHYPLEKFEYDIGRYQTPDVPQSGAWDLTSLTMYETQIGVCLGSTDCYDIAANKDWLWQLVDGTLHDTVLAGPPPGVTPTIRQLLFATKDRLVQSPGFDPNPQAGNVYEVQVTRDFVTSELSPRPAGCTGEILDCNPKLWPALTMHTMLRKYAGALLMSPAYLMANLPTVTTQQSLPAVILCRPNEICTKADLDAHYADALCRLRYTCL